MNDMISAYIGDEPYVFISYSHKDMEQVMNIIRIINGLGYRIWYDEGIEVGEDFQTEIAQRVRHCTQFITVLSKQSINSKWVKKELKLAEARDKKILPIYLEEVELPDDMEHIVIGIQGIMYYKNYDNLEKLLDRGLKQECKIINRRISDTGKKEAEPLVKPVIYNTEPKPFQITKANEPEETPRDALLLKDVETGSYITFGTYHRNPILWQVIDKNVYGILLFSKNILSLKSFDKSNRSEYGANEKAFLYGSNQWSSSTLRTWLNTSGIVSYDPAIPDRYHVWNGLNSYAQEEGFLSGFSNCEQNLICETRLNSITGEKAGTYHFNHSPDSISIDITKYKFDLSKDKVFLLSLSELKVNVIDRKFDYRSEPTEESIINSEYKSKYLRSGSYWWYWLRDALPGSTHAVQCISETERIGIYSAYYGNIGVRPALYLQSDAVITAGAGTSEFPYVIKP